MRKPVLLLVVAFFVMVAPLHAKDFYIAQRAAGNGSGTSGCSNAAPLSWFNTTTNWGTGTRQIGPGTTVHLCGTFTAAAGTNLLTFHGSGASGAPIRLLFESGAVLQAPYFGNVSAAAINTNRNTWLIIDGGSGHGIIRATANGSALGNRRSSLAIVASGCSNCEILNLTIANMYVHSLTSDTTPLNSEGCIYFNGSQSNVSIHNNVMHDAHWCISYNFGPADNNIKIYDNTIYNIDHAIAIAGASSGSTSNVSIYHNHIYSYKNWDTGSANVYHHDGIHAFGSNSRINNLAIYGNEFDGPVGGNVTGHIFLQSGAGISDVMIYNNVFFTDTVVNSGMVDVSSGQNGKVFNNTFISKGVGACYRTNTNLSGHAFQNNVMVNCNNLISVQNVSFSSGSPNHNVYAQGGSIAFQCGTKFFNFSQFASWKSCIAGDANSTSTSSAGLSTAGVPLIGSIVLGKGANLTSMCTGQMAALCKDRSGMARPTTGTWIPGAYNQGANPLSAPTGLTASIQ